MLHLHSLKSTTLAISMPPQVAGAPAPAPEAGTPGHAAPAPEEAPAAPGSGTAPQRLVFFDNLRVVLMTVVIAHHVGQAYGPTGGWWPVQEPARAAILGPFFMVNRSFGMSLFFMIAGYFTVMAIEKSGITPFVKSRLQRLGIPLLAFSLLIMALQVFVFGLLSTGQLGPAWPVDVVHLWFVQHLLLYSLGYALWCLFRPDAGRQAARPMNPPGYGTVVACALGLALLTFIVRIWFQIDEWVQLLGYIRVAFADVPRDLALFLVGTVAYRHQWVTRFPSRAGRVWLAVGLVLAGFWYALELWLRNVIVVSDTAWEILIPVWESLLVFGMCIGWTVFFRDHVNTQGRFVKELARSTYLAYMLHLFIVILFQTLALGVAADPLVKFFLLTLITVPVTFLLASLIRRPLRL